MKRIFVSLMLVVTVGSASAIAVRHDDGVNNRVRETFAKEFAQAKSVQWNNLGDYQMATFVLNEHRIEAYFNTETGDLEGSARYVLFDQLPLVIVRSFEKNFVVSDIISVLEVSNYAGTFYRFIMETQNKRYFVRIGSDGSLMGVKKIRK